MNLLSRMLVVCLGIAFAASVAWGQTEVVVQKDEPGDRLKRSETAIHTYTDWFRQSGVPTPVSVDAAFKSAEEGNTLEAWQSAARLANSYAHIVDILSKHYMKHYEESTIDGSEGNVAFLSTAANYEARRDDYIAARNLAYLRIAKLLFDKGDKVQALSYALTAVELAGAELSQEGETLIQQIIEYKP